MPLKHRMCATPEYKAWEGAKTRVFNLNCPAAKNYSGRGITMSEEWAKDFMAFFRHIGSKPTPLHSLERINNDRGYEPGNVRWATEIEQQSNRRTTVLLPWGVGLVTLTEFARLTGIPNQTLSRWRKALSTEALLERCGQRIMGVA